MSHDLFSGYPDILTADQLAEALRLSRAGAYQLMHQQGFPTLQVGKRLLVPKKALISWIESHTRPLSPREDCLPR